MQKASIAALFLVSSLAASALVPIGCGTGEADSLFDEASSGNPGATGSGAGGEGTGGAGPGSSSSGTPSTSSSTTGAGGMGAGGMGTGGMGTGGMGTGGMGTGGMGTGGMGGSGPTNEVLCANNMMCSIDNLGACCWAEQTDTGDCVQGPADMDNCSQSQSGGNTRIECMTDAQCGAGLVCCGDRSNGDFGTYYWQVTCQAQCDDVKMCATPGPDPSCPLVTCQQGQQVQGVCNPSALLPAGYYVCGCP